MNWFDRAVVKLATDGLSRRSFLASASVITATLATKPFSALAFDINPPPKPLPGPHPNPVNVHGIPGWRGSPPTSRTHVFGPFQAATQNRNVTWSYKGEVSVDGIPSTISIKRTSTYQPQTGPPSSVSVLMSMQVIHGGQLAFETIRRFTSSLPSHGLADGSVSCQFGPAIPSLKTAALLARNGEVTGNVNGTAIAPMRLGQSGTLRYSDGRDVLGPAVSPELSKALAALQVKVKTDAEVLEHPAPGPIHPIPVHTPSPIRPLDLPCGEDEAGTDQNTLLNWVTPDCQSCMKNCWDVTLVCDIVTVFCLGLCTAACTAGWDTVCEAHCLIPGGGCCETFCSVGSCCDNGYSCCGGYGSICCDNSQTTCAGPNRDTCCPLCAPVGCGSPVPVCLIPGTTCCGTTASGYCMPNERCMSNGCVEGFQCGNNWCPKGSQCINGNCGLGKPCTSPTGTVSFCSFTQTCVNGTCVSNTPANNCPSGLVVCQSTNEGPGPATVCCPPNMKCCGGKCCTNVADLCCAPGGNPFGCYSTCIG